MIGTLFTMAILGLALVACASAAPNHPTPSGGASTTPEPSPTTNAPAASTTSPSSPTSSGETPTTAPAPTASGGVTQPGTPSVPPGATLVLDLARRDLAGRTGIAANQVAIVSLTKVEWPNSALGCPQPGFMYSQIVTPGYKIVLQASGTTYEYHTDATGQRVVECPNPGP